MAHTYGCCLYHFVFSTLNRENLIDLKWIRELWNYMGGVAKHHEMKSLGIGGTENHVHALIMIPPAISPAKGIQLVKGNASKWVNETLGLRYRFDWQVGYGVFTIGFSQIERTQQYIANQSEHHRKKTFEDEYRAFLKKHMIEVNEDYLWG